MSSINFSLQQEAGVAAFPMANGPKCKLGSYSALQGESQLLHSLFHVGDLDLEPMAFQNHTTRLLPLLLYAAHSSRVLNFALTNMAWACIKVQCNLPNKHTLLDCTHVCLYGSKVSVLLKHIGYALKLQNTTSYINIIIE